MSQRDRQYFEKLVYCIAGWTRCTETVNTLKRWCTVSNVQWRDLISNTRWPEYRPKVVFWSQSRDTFKLAQASLCIARASLPPRLTAQTASVYVTTTYVKNIRTIMNTCKVFYGIYFRLSRILRWDIILSCRILRARWRVSKLNSPPNRAQPFLRLRHS